MMKVNVKCLLNIIFEMYWKRKEIFTRKLFFNEILQSILLDIYLYYNIRVVNVLNRIFFHTYCWPNVSTIRKKTIFWEHILWLIYTHTHCAHKSNDIKADLNWGFLTLYYISNGGARIVFGSARLSTNFFRRYKIEYNLKKSIFI